MTDQEVVNYLEQGSTRSQAEGLETQPSAVEGPMFNKSTEVQPQISQKIFFKAMSTCWNGELGGAVGWVMSRIRVGSVNCQ